MADDQDAIGPWHILVGPESPAQDWLHPEYREVIGRHVAALEARRHAGDADRGGAKRFGRQRVKNPAAFLEFDEVTGGSGVCGVVVRRLLHPDDPVWRGEG